MAEDSWARYVCKLLFLLSQPSPGGCGGAAAAYTSRNPHNVIKAAAAVQFRLYKHAKKE